MPGFGSNRTSTQPRVVEPMQIRPVNDPAYDEYLAKRAKQAQPPSNKDVMMKRAFGILALALLAIVVVFFGFLLYKYVAKETAQVTPDKPAVIDAVNPAEYFIVNYKSNMARLCRQNATEIRSKKYKEWEELKPIHADNKKRITDEATKPGADLIQSTNGKWWVAQTDDPKDIAEAGTNREEAAKAWELMAEGFEK